jgi:hypothetical protein
LKPLDLNPPNREESAMSVVSGGIFIGRRVWLRRCWSLMASARRTRARHASGGQLSLNRCAPRAPLHHILAWPLERSEYSLWTREPEKDVIPVLEELGIGFDGGDRRVLRAPSRGYGGDWGRAERPYWRGFLPLTQRNTCCSCRGVKTARPPSSMLRMQRSLPERALGIHR